MKAGKPLLAMRGEPFLRYHNEAISIVRRFTEHTRIQMQPHHLQGSCKSETASIPKVGAILNFHQKRTVPSIKPSAIQR